MKHTPIHLLPHKNISTAKKIHHIFQRSYRIEANLIGVEDFPPLRRTINSFQKSNTHFYGFLKNDELTALIEIDVDENQLEICSLVVDPLFFRQGLASQMMEYILEKFPRNISVVETATVNSPAISLYEKYGFSIKKKWRLKIGIEKVVMVREN